MNTHMYMDMYNVSHICVYTYVFAYTHTDAPPAIWAPTKAPTRSAPTALASE